MPEGSVLRCMARYDNSADNPSNPDPKKVVTWGEQTHEEMLVGYVEVASADQDLAGRTADRKLDDGRYQVTFRYRPPAGTKAVYLAGTFNDWKPTALAMEGPDASGVLKPSWSVQRRPRVQVCTRGTRWRHDAGNRRQAGYYHNSVIDLGAAH